MNQTFSFQRWSLLVAKHWAENRKRYLMSVVAMIGLLFMWFVFVMKTDDLDPMAEGLQQITYFFSLFLAGPFFATQFYREIHSKTKGINYLLLPASTLEKLVCGLFYTLLVFFVVFTLVFYIADSIAVMAANAIHPSYNTTAPGGIHKAELVNVFNMKGGKDTNLAYHFILLFMALQSAALLGSAYFSNYSYIKTAITLCVLFIVVLLIESFFFGKLLPSGSLDNTLTTFRFHTPDDKLHHIQLPQWIGVSIAFLAKYAFHPLFWITTYYRLKEKEV